MARTDQFTRRIFDRDGNTVFAYGVDASAGLQPGTITIKIKPLEAKLEDLVRRGRAGKTPLNPQSGPVPTIAAAREFAGLKPGQAVTLEVLYNPSTGEKVYDVLRPCTGVTPNQNATADAALAGEELSFREISLVVNGEKIAAPGGWLTGAVARLYLPGRGAYFLSTYAPKNQAFRQAVYVDRHNLEFAQDGDFVRITSSDNVLTRAESGIIWVYRDAKYRPQSQPDKADLVFADKVESLLSRQ